MKVQVVPATHFTHNEYQGVKGVPMAMAVAQAKLLRDNGLVEDFDETQSAEDAEAEAKAAQEHANKKADEPENKGASVTVNQRNQGRQGRNR